MELFSIKIRCTFQLVSTLYMLGKCFSQRVVNSYLKVFVIWKHGRIWFIGNVDIFNISVPGFFGRKIKKSLE